MVRRALALACAALVAAPPIGAHAQVESREIRVGMRDAPVLRLTEVVRLGSLEGPNDAFGRVMDVALDSQGRVLVADDLNHHVAVFEANGRFVGRVGRRGAGPGELESPWKVAVDARDSIFVWDMAHARISVFGPDLVFGRSFRVPSQWSVGSIGFLPDGRLLLAAYGPHTDGTLHVLDRDGHVETTFGPTFTAPDLAGFESSLLGGTVAMLDRGWVYSVRSPYELWFFDPDGSARLRCVGQPDWTTRPAAVVERREGGAALHWTRYMHSYNVVPVADGLVLNLVLDPAGDRAVMDLVSPDCTLLRRTTVPIPVTITAASGTRLAAVRNLEYPEVVVYDQRVER